MQTVDDWISYLEMLQRQLGVKNYSIIVKDVIQLLKASPKDLSSREAWLLGLGTSRQRIRKLISTLSCRSREDARKTCRLGYFASGVRIGATLLARSAGI